MYYSLELIGKAIKIHNSSKPKSHSFLSLKLPINAFAFTRCVVSGHLIFLPFILFSHWPERIGEKYLCWHAYP